MQSVERKAVNVSTVPQFSPFRYPGGKTWLIPWIREWLNALGAPIHWIVEPFAGGGAVSLASVFEGLAQRAVLVERDEGIAAVWQTIFSPHAEQFAKRVVAFDCTPSSVQQLLVNIPETTEDLAFATLVCNRTRYGGIVAPGAAVVRQGENGRGIASRWYPETLKRRILAIAAQRGRLHFVHGDGMEYLRQTSQSSGVAFYIDPPYTVAGRRLYKYSAIDHEALFSLASQLEGDFLMTYDDAIEIRNLADRHGFDVEEVPMKSTKHELKLELLIGRDLTWARDNSSLEFGQNTLFKVS